jgi:hypothetical protein
MDLAKQGDPQAIAALINRSLASKGIHASAVLEGNCLKISLQAMQIPNPKAVVTIIQRGMLVLQVEKIKRVKILTYRSDNDYLAWQQEIELDELDSASNQSHSDFPNERMTSNIGNIGSIGNSREDNSTDIIGLSEPALLSQRMQSPNANLANKSKGVILVQSLSQIQQNLQEYQDVIVRFTDEQVGTVRCLTTLTELIQVISKPSFLFAAVAANPNLRSLLDAIAESSHTDEHGDQVIQNLSILQPGQQWQKAKVRLVTKIFLEPAQTEDGGNRQANRQQDRHQGITLDLTEEMENLPEQPSKAVLIDDVNDSEQAETANLEPSPPLVDLHGASSDRLDQPQDLPKQDLPKQEDTDEEISQILLEQLSKQLSEKLSGEAMNGDPVIATPAPSAAANPALEAINADAADDNVTAESLFDDFVDAPQIAVKEQPRELSSAQPNVQPITAELAIPTAPMPIMKEPSGGDLFDGFGSSDNVPVAASSEQQPVNGYVPIAQSINTQAVEQPTEDLSLGDLFNDFESNNVMETRQISDDTLTIDTDDDLFNNFGDKGNVSAQSSELEANTIEQLMSNIESIPLSKTSNDSRSPNYVTLADFSEDLESVGF